MSSVLPRTVERNENEALKNETGSRVRWQRLREQVYEIPIFCLFYVCLYHVLFRSGRIALFEKDAWDLVPIWGILKPTWFWSTSYILTIALYLMLLVTALVAALYIDVVHRYQNTTDDKVYLFSVVELPRKASIKTRVFVMFCNYFNVFVMALSTPLVLYITISYVFTVEGGTLYQALWLLAECIFSVSALAALIYSSKQTYKFLYLQEKIEMSKPFDWGDFQITVLDEYSQPVYLQTAQTQAQPVYGVRRDSTMSTISQTKSSNPLDPSNAKFEVTQARSLRSAVPEKIPLEKMDTNEIILAEPDFNNNNLP